MKSLIAHWVRENLSEIASKSRCDCHVKGVDSIMLLDKPGSTVRLFIATPDHELHPNRPSRFDCGLTVGFHPHHCAVTLVGVAGIAVNWMVKEAPSGYGVETWRWSSVLRGGLGGFTHMGSTWLQSIAITDLRPGDELEMMASELHTMAVDKGRSAAWFVFEGKEDPNYKSLCYSNQDLRSFSAEGLYRPMPKTQVLAHLDALGLI